MSPRGVSTDDVILTILFIASVGSTIDRTFESLLCKLRDAPGAPIGHAWQALLRWATGEILPVFSSSPTN